MMLRRGAQHAEIRCETGLGQRGHHAARRGAGDTQHDVVPDAHVRAHPRVFGERAHLAISFEKSGLDQKLDPETQLTIFRVLQESLNNCAKHAKAKQVKVGLTFGEDSLVLTIADDGTGFAEAAVSPGHYGLVHLRERARRLLGEASVRSAPGQGTIITLTLPTGDVALPEAARV